MALDVPGFGTKLEYGDKGDGTSTTWTAITEIHDIDPPEMEADDIDTTNMGSTGKVRTFQSGLINPGLFKAICAYSATAYQTLLGFVGTQKDMRITFNDKVATSGSTMALQGYVKKLGAKTPMDGIDTFELDYKVSGAPVFTPAT